MNNLFKKLCIGLAVCLPLLALNVFKSYKIIDFVPFLENEVALKEDAKAFYVKKANYPIVGVLATGGVLSIIDDFSKDIAVKETCFRYFLCFFDVCIIFGIFLVFRYFQVTNPELKTLFIATNAVLWAGGAIFGQIDNIGQVLFMVSFGLLFYISSLINTQKLSSNVCYLLFAFGLVFSLSMLCKQLLIFGNFALSIYALYILCLVWINTKSFKYLSFAVFVGLLGFSLPILTSDSFLVFPENYISHLTFVFLGGGVGHSSQIAMQGFNIWVNLGFDTLNNSNVTMYGGLTPNFIGKMLFIASLCVFWLMFFYNNYRFKLSIILLEKRLVLYVFLFFFCFIQLAMNVFLTGTHERYLYHFYPTFLVLLMLIPKEALLDGIINITYLCGTFLGLYVLNIISPQNEWFFLAHNTNFISGIHFILFIMVLLQWNKYLKILIIKDHLHSTQTIHNPK